jgi:hypothetical protein
VIHTEKSSGLGVPLQIGEKAAQSSFDDREWFRTITRDELGTKALHQAIRRRSTQICRRAFRHGIRRALKFAQQRQYEKGSGYWIAPHLWFVTHLTRDEDEETNIFGNIGQPWRTLIPMAARSEFYGLLRRLQIDLLFVEDGVRPKAVERVLQSLFDHDDRKPNQPLTPEHPFVGIPGIHEILHEHSLGGQLGKKDYPEPDYEEVGRARILHIFKARGGEEAPIEDPVEQGSRPVLSTVG